MLLVQRVSKWHGKLNLPKVLLKREEKLSTVTKVFPQPWTYFNRAIKEGMELVSENKGH
jgi:hypothetical protein